MTAEGCEHCAGGVFVGNQTNGTIINCIIRGNVGRNLTGGIEYNGECGVIANNWIIGNYGGATPSSVGGVAVFPDADVAIVNNTISGNLGPGQDGVAGVLIHEGSSISRFDNNIASFNTPGRGLVSKQAIAGLDLMRRAGVQVVYGTDLLGNLYTEQCREFTLRREVFTPLELLRQATSTAAEMMMMQGQIGCVAPGAFADLIVVDGDPLADIGLVAANGERLSLIMHGGELVKNRL